MNDKGETMKNEKYQFKQSAEGSKQTEGLSTAEGSQRLLDSTTQRLYNLSNLFAMEITMEYYLVISTIMFFAGIYGFITRRNMLAVLISIELILNSVDINFVAFNRFLFPGQLEGFFFTLFAIGISACETAIAIAIIINIYRNIRNIQVKNLNELKD